MFAGYYSAPLTDIQTEAEEADEMAADLLDRQEAIDGCAARSLRKPDGEVVESIFTNRTNDAPVAAGRVVEICPDFDSMSQVFRHRHSGIIHYAELVTSDAVSFMMLRRSASGRRSVGLYVAPAKPVY